MDQFESIRDQLQKEWDNLQIQNSQYLKAVDRSKELQTTCAASVKHCRTYLRFLKKEAPKLAKSADGPTKAKLDRVRADIEYSDYALREVEECLPRSTGIYLRIVLGALNISLWNKQDKFLYKSDYEQFKIIVSAISAVFAFILYFFTSNRVADVVFLFLLVWYYCTLTIRERILIANGSRIKGWWNIYHFISTAGAGIMLIWPASRSYDEFRDQFMLFSLYLNIVHCFQYQYQIGSLYKLRTLGCGHLMDITVDGFMSWMYRRLTFLIPILFSVYASELYNAYRLYQLSRQPYCFEWQVTALAIIYSIFGLGNIITMSLVIYQKCFLSSPSKKMMYENLRRKYSFTQPSGDHPLLEGVTSSSMVSDDSKHK